MNGSQESPHNVDKLAFLSWQSKKEDLADRGRLHRLFLTTADDNARTFSNAARGKLSAEELKYEPLLFEAWLQDVSQLADRVLAYRREARELEILAVKAAMDYELGHSLTAIDRDLQTLLVQKSVKEKAKITQDTAAKEFANQPTQRGFFALAAGRSAELAIEIESANQQLALIDKKWQLQNAYLESYWSKNNQPGNAHNYAERAQRVYELLGEDLTEAHVKALAIRVGVETVHRKELPPIPPTDTVTFVDDFVLWIRSCIRWLEWVSQNTTDFTLIVPLTQPWAGSLTPILDPEKLREALQKAKANKNHPVSLEFVLSDGVFLGFRPRLKGVGLSYGNRVGLVISSGIDKNATSDSYARIRAIIETPEQVDLVSGRNYQRPPVTLGSVGIFGAAPIAFESGDTVTNVNPSGKWKITLYPSLVYKDDTERNIGDGIEGEPMLDLKLHLRLRTWNSENYAGSLS